MKTAGGEFYEIPFSEGGYTCWRLWPDFPHVSVSLHFDNVREGQNVSAAGIAERISALSWRENLLRGMEKAQLKRVHRAFIFLADGERELGEPMRSAVHGAELSYEIFCEIVLSKSLFYAYYGLAEFFDQKAASCVEILSVAPSRTLQARQSGLYEHGE